MVGKRKRELPVSGDINVIPFIDMLSVIIIFLIMVASFLNIGVVETSMPKGGGSPAQIAEPQKKEQKEKLNLTIAITEKGFYVGGAGAILQERAGEPTIPKKDGKYDFKALNDKLWEIKQHYPDEWDVVILPEDNIDYQTIIKTMDAARERWVEENGKKVKKYLFPNVAIAAGIF